MYKYVGLVMLKYVMYNMMYGWVDTMILLEILVKAKYVRLSLRFPKKMFF